MGLFESFEQSALAPGHGSDGSLSKIACPCHPHTPPCIGSTDTDSSPNGTPSFCPPVLLAQRLLNDSVSHLADCWSGVSFVEHLSLCVSATSALYRISYPDLCEMPTLCTSLTLHRLVPPHEIHQIAKAVNAKESRKTTPEALSNQTFLSSVISVSCFLVMVLNSEKLFCDGLGRESEHYLLKVA